MSLSFPETTRSQAHSAGSSHFTSQSPLIFQIPGGSGASLAQLSAGTLQLPLSRIPAVSSLTTSSHYFLSAFEALVSGLAGDAWELPVFPCSVFGGVARPA